MTERCEAFTRAVGAELRDTLMAAGWLRPEGSPRPAPPAAAVRAAVVRLDDAGIASAAAEIVAAHAPATVCGMLLQFDPRVAAVARRLLEWRQRVAATAPARSGRARWAAGVAELG